jgi:hypothetical protein
MRKWSYLTENKLHICYEVTLANDGYENHRYLPSSQNEKR